MVLGGTNSIQSYKKQRLRCLQLITRETLSKKIGHMVGLNMMSSLIHSGTNLSSVPRDRTWYNSSASSPGALLIHDKLKE